MLHLYINDTQTSCSILVFTMAAAAAVCVYIDFWMFIVLVGIQNTCRHEILPVNKKCKWCLPLDFFSHSSLLQLLTRTRSPSPASYSHTYQTLFQLNRPHPVVPRPIDLTGPEKPHQAVVRIDNLSWSPCSFSHFLFALGVFEGVNILIWLLFRFPICMFISIQWNHSFIEH